MPEAAPSAPGTPRPARRRGRTTLLIACAAVLGVVAGVCTGYIVQADRAPDRLPALSQPAIEQAKGEPQPLSAARDRVVRTDGDLRRLLLRAPKGAHDRSGGMDDNAWMDAQSVASTYERPEWAFSELLEAGFRRAATVTWTENGLDVEIRLTQYRDVESLATRDAALEQQEAMNSNFEAGTPEYIPGSGNGVVHVGSRRSSESGLYEAEAVAARGDLLMDIWITGDRPVGKKRAVQLARAQWERM
ncbi:hypothetical protein OKJ48_07260 [Streptomyces kunmingensis]|uniref:Serine/threonine protein kinase n=1 Tax=Streptomyces kunmingensis TaxID=68225 RepID=A0ABU6C871_9ACTN|nr:hypothetical protein [Streptomyces kunmingensis]MEB3960050.1 hypothetical protein [Streptomyces kunmingensis]